MKRYVNFEVELFEHRSENDTESLCVRVAQSPAGEQSIDDAEQVMFPSRLRERLERLERRQLELDDLVELGEDLASLLLPLSVRRLFERSLDRLRSADTGLRLRVKAGSPGLAALPWEYVYAGPPDQARAVKEPRSFLALDPRISIVRHEVIGEPVAEVVPLRGDEIRLVALLSDVDDPAYARLDLEREELHLRQALDGAGPIDARFLRPGTLDQLEQARAAGGNIFHFSGHGEFQREMGEEPGTTTGIGKLILSGDDRRPMPFDVDKLAKNLIGKGFRLAVLNACEAAQRDRVTPWSGIAPALARQGIPAVVGMQFTVRDRNAIAFSRAFYRSLAAGMSIDSAVTEGRIGVFSRTGAAERDWGVPVLYLRGTASVLFPPSPVQLRRNVTLAAISAVLLCVWFFVHAYPFFVNHATTILNRAGIGVAAGLALFWALRWIGSRVRKMVWTNEGPWLERLLRHRATRSVLVAVLAATVLLCATTSSIYVTLDDPEVRTVTVEVRNAAGSPFEPAALSVSRQGVAAGRPMLLRFPPAALDLEVSTTGLHLPGATEKPRAWPWSPVSLSVKLDMERTTLRVVRLALDSDVISLLPKLDHENPRHTYTLRLTIDGGNPIELRDLRKGLIYLGGSQTLVEEMVSAEDGLSLDADLVNACTLPGFPPPGSSMLALWRSHQRIDDTPIFADGQALRIEIIKDEDSAVLSSTNISTSDLRTDRIETLCMAQGGGT